MSSRRRLRPRVVIRVVLVLLATSTLLAAPQAGAQEDAGSGAGLGGFQGTAGAYGVKGFYFPEGSGLPLGEFVDVGVPDAFATIATGPATFARSSIADPGDLIANPNALIGAANPDAPRVPEYPYRISARSSSGEPEAEISPAPGLRSSVEATESGSTAESSAGETAAPALVTTGAITTTAETTTDGSTVTVHSRTEISAIDVLGVVTLESVVIDTTATSDGTTTTAEGGTTIGHATVLDTPVVIDSDGIHPEPGEEEPTVPLVGDVIDTLAGGGGGDDEEAGVLSVLEEAGVEISLASPRDYEVEGAAGMAATGLRIDLVFSDETVPLLSDLFDALPPIDNPVPEAPGVEDAIALIEANNMFAVEFGGAFVDLSARPGFEFTPATPPASTSSPVSTPSLSSGVSSSPTPSSSTSPGTTAPSTTVAAPAPSSAAATERPTPAALSAGIGALALVALLLQPLLGERLARAAGAILSAQPAACPREGR